LPLIRNPYYKSYRTLGLNPNALQINDYKSTISLASIVFLATTDVAISRLAKVSKVSFALSKGSISFYISLLLANAIVLIINKNGSQESK
jgi:hypothetical protein